jgi:hypothetical protein
MTTTNLSNERLAEYANDKRMCNINDEIVSMASELLALRDAAEKPVSAAVFKPVADLFGFRAPGSLAWSFTEDANGIPEMISRGWPVTQYVTLERFQQAYAAPQLPAEPVSQSYKLPDGWVIVPKEPTENMVIAGFESAPDSFFSAPDEWAAYEAMSGCQQAAHKAKLCWSAMLAAVPKTEPAGEPKKKK